MMDYCSMETKAEQLRAHLHTAEESVSLRLDTSRNQLLVADTVLSICTLAIGIGSFVGSIFGMNLHNHVEDGTWQFMAVTWGTVGGIVMFVYLGIYICKRRGIIPSSSHVKSLWHQSENAPQLRT
jgi:Mg2+ and Co2+ transporter CorA